MPTMVVPTGKAEPDGGLQMTVPPADVMGVKFTVAVHWPRSVIVKMSAGQVIVGGGFVTRTVV